MTKKLEDFREVSLEEILKRARDSDFFKIPLGGKGKEMVSSKKSSQLVILEDGTTFDGFPLHDVYLRARNKKPMPKASEGFESDKQEILKKLTELCGCEPTGLIKYWSQYMRFKTNYDILLSLDPPRMERISLIIDLYSE
jgi:hypothetical protein